MLANSSRRSSSWSLTPTNAIHAFASMPSSRCSSTLPGSGSGSYGSLSVSSSAQSPRACSFFNQMPLNLLIMVGGFRLWAFLMYYASQGEKVTFAGNWCPCRQTGRPLMNGHLSQVTRLTGPDLADLQCGHSRRMYHHERIWPDWARCVKRHGTRTSAEPLRRSAFDQAGSSRSPRATQ